MNKASKVSRNNSPQSRQSSSRRRIEDVLRQRERLIAELQGLSTIQGCSESAKKAQQLLTRWWARADWKARVELLRVAEWVIRVEVRGGA